MMGQEDRRYFWTGLGVSVLLFVVFKLFYPYPNMVKDSYVYLKAAVLNLEANSFPIGYSKFMQVLIFLGCSANWIVAIQFLILDATCLLFFQTIRYFFRPSTFVSIFLWIFLFCNPLLYYLSNFIMSDTLFTALSLFWVVQLIWLIDRPSGYMIWSHGLTLFLVFSLRYNALYYPLVSLLAILLSGLGFRFKLIAIGLPVLLIGCFILYTRTEMKKLTGISQFSAFGGWQLANNALYMYGHVYHGEAENFEGELGQLDATVRRYFDSTGHVESLLKYNAKEPGFYYSADANSPLLQYMYRKYGPDTVFQDFKKWGPMGELCSRYGAGLVKSNPIAFAEYFVWPNAIRFFYPPEEIFAKLSPYFLPRDGFGQMARQALGVRTLTVGMDLIRFRNRILSVYPTFFMLLNIWYLFAFVGFWVVGEPKRQDKCLRRIILVIFALWLCNFLFSVTASCIVLRYQVLTMIVTLAFALLLTDLVYRQSDKVKATGGNG
jgi:hypothetical protein